MKYLDFDLLVDRNADGYRARVLESPAGQASSNFNLPFSDVEVENFLLRLGRPRRGVRRLESPELATARSFGGRLFEAVFAGEIRGLLRGSLNEANRAGAGLRLRLRIGDATELMALPWEYLYDAAADRFLVLSNQTPLVRYLEVAETIQPLPIKPPLKILFMAASPPGYAAIDLDREFAKLEEAVAEWERQGAVEVTRLPTGSLGALQQQLRRGQFHIFHFVGHGVFDEGAQDGVLLLEGDAGEGRPVSARDLGVLLHDHRSLRLALLNACEGARTSRSDPFAGAAQSLVLQGIPAVIAMQFEVTDEAAVVLGREFYGALADGYPVDAALTEARKALLASADDVEWGTPVLYLSAADGVLFEMTGPPEARVEANPAASPVTLPGQDRRSSTRGPANGAGRGAGTAVSSARRKIAAPGLASVAQTLTGGFLIGFSWFLIRLMLDDASWVWSLPAPSDMSLILFGPPAAIAVWATLWTRGVSWRRGSLLLLIVGWMAGAYALSSALAAALGGFIGGLATGWALTQVEPGYTPQRAFTAAFGWAFSFLLAWVAVSLVAVQSGADPGYPISSGLTRGLVCGLAGLGGGAILMAQLAGARRNAGVARQA